MARLLVIAALLAASCRSVDRAPRAYVTNEDDGTISVIDLERREVVATVAVGKRPRGVRVVPHDRALYVALSGSAKAPPGVDESTLPPPDRAADGIGVLGLDELAVRRVVASGPDPESFDLAGATLVVSNEDTARVALVDPAASVVRAHVDVGGEPEGVTTAPDGTAWVTCEAADRVDVIDPRSATRVASIPVGKRPRAIAFAGGRGYVTNELGASVSVVDVATREVVATIEIPAHDGLAARPMGVAIARDGSRVFVSTGRGRTVAVIDPDTDRVTEVIAGVGDRPWGVAVGPDGLVYTANGPSDDVAVIDPDAGAVVARIAVGASPWGVAMER